MDIRLLKSVFIHIEYCFVHRCITRVFFGVSMVLTNNKKYVHIKNLIEKRYGCTIPYFWIFCKKMCLYTLDIFL